MNFSRGKMKWSTLIPLPENFVFTPLLKVDILESYGDWALCKITLSYTHTNKEGEKKEYKESIYFILDHLGRIRKWNLFRFMLESEWSKIKSQIRRKNVSDDWVGPQNKFSTFRLKNLKTVFYYNIDWREGISSRSRRSKNSLYFA